MSESTVEVFTTKYAGASWLLSNVKYWPKMAGKEVSPLGLRAADLLGYVYRGLYHLGSRRLEKTDWSDLDLITIVVHGQGRMASYDGADLTRLVIAAHDACMRVEIEGASSWGYLRLFISAREGRTGRLYSRHPTIEDAIKSHREDR